MSVGTCWCAVCGHQLQQAACVKFRVHVKAGLCVCASACVFVCVCGFIFV
jgi:hypothetical protein